MLYVTCLEREKLIGKEISGTEFNKLFNAVKFIKLTNANEIHHNFQFNDGLNIDVCDFCPQGVCLAGGIYFTEEKEAHNWIFYHPLIGPMKYMRKIEIPNDARIYIEHYAFKANKVILGERQEIHNEMYLKAIKTSDSIFANLTDDMKSKEVCMEYVRHSYPSLCYIPPNILDKEICMESVKSYGKSLKHVPTDMVDKFMCEIAIKNDCYALKYVSPEIKNKELCMIAVKVDFYTLKYIPYPLKNELIDWYTTKSNFDGKVKS